MSLLTLLDFNAFIGSLTACSTVVLDCVVLCVSSFAILFIILLLQHTRATNDIKCIDPFTADSNIRNEFD